jgi:hypothetical protein
MTPRNYGLKDGFAFEGKGDDKRRIAVTMPDVDPEPESETVTPPRDFEPYANRVLDVLDGPPRTCAARVAAFKHIIGRDARPLRAIADEIGCSVSTIHGAIKAVEAKLFSRPANTVSEVKKGKREHAAHI